MAKLTKQDVQNFRQSIDASGEARFHIMHSPRGLGCAIRMWHHDGMVLSRCGGGGYDKEGTVLGDALEKLFPEELKALPLPSDPRKPGDLYGLNASSDGKRYLQGASGLRSMIQIFEAMGFEVNEYSTGKYSTMILARRK